MKVNSFDDQPKPKTNFIFYLFLAVFIGFILFVLFSGATVLTKLIWNFLRSYWHFVILGILALLFLKRWFKKKEIVVQKVPQEYY